MQLVEQRQRVGRVRFPRSPAAAPAASGCRARRRTRLGSSRCVAAGACSARRHLRPGRQRRARGAVGDQFDHREQAVAAATSPIIACRACMLLQPREQLRAQRARALDQAFALRRPRARPRPRRRTADGRSRSGRWRASRARACARSRRQHDRAERQVRAGQALGERHQVRAAASPWRCQANHSPQRPKPLITSSAISSTPRSRVSSRSAGQ